MLRSVPQLICTVMEQQLDGAIRGGELRLDYQPQVNLMTHQVVAYEALVRWRHPTRGLLLPGAFLPLVQGSVIMRDLTVWVLDTALRDWSVRERPGPPVAVNICPTDLDDDAFVEVVFAILHRHGVPAEMLKLELTEHSLLVRPKHAVEVLRRLHLLGVRLSIDDFGTGYSSLTHLRDFPVSEVKIDRSFIEALPASRRTQKIVQTVVTLGHHLGIDVVGEGVSSPELERYLAATGCEIGQGYYLGRPSPLEEEDLPSLGLQLVHAMS